MSLALSARLQLGMLSFFWRNGVETPEPLKADVSGSIPQWLQGTLLRNGPGLFSVGNTSYKHWFDGMALIHSFTFKDGDVFYRSKFLQSETYKKNTAANRIVVSEFGTMVYPDPCKNIFSKAFSYLVNAIPDFTDNNLINIIRYGEDYYASSEVNYINKIDPLTLDTLGRTNYRNHIAINLATAHPHYDDEGNTYNMGTAIMNFGRPKYVIFKVPANASDKEKNKPALTKVEQVCSIPFRSSLYPSYFHSFGMTENYIIFVEQAFKLDILKLATAYFRDVNWGSCLKFDKDDITVIHLINRKTGKPVSIKYHADPFVFFHHINAYEEDGHVVFDLITYQDSNLYNMFYIHNMKQDVAEFIENNKDFSRPTCQRFVLPLNIDKETPPGTNLVVLRDTKATAVLQDDGSLHCTPDTIFEGLELPGINYKFNSKKYRYFYGTRVDWSPYPSKIAKVDIVTRTHIVWTEEECYPSEPVFVASPDAVEEDDGIILSSVVSFNPQKPPFLVVLDAKSFKEIARATIDAAIHMDLHGIFIHDKST
ncbi:beta-carotene oxygenase 1, like [Pimephales promelas]|uniref:beta-carotene oxygenase 1, like n=1 Tax=Pimephales promelas TaxID=90988 RepID=UPI001955D37A|nr:beta-carotene oxygenase 1, like [Pimephales promelas]KAG1941331.1 beta,beta-carotene 9',10'-oxygenase [Pimephales promelas]